MSTATLQVIKVPIRKIKDMRRFLKGIDTTIVREKDRI